MDLRTAPLHEMVEEEISKSLNTPGLAHIETQIRTCTGDDAVSAKIDFMAGGMWLGVSLFVNVDGSFILIEADNTVSSWTADEADPEPVTRAVIDILRYKVEAAA